MGKGVGLIFGLIGFLVILLLTCYIIVSLFDEKKAITVFGYKSYSVITDSMDPAVKRNDLVIVKKHSSDKLKEGDIITFYVKSKEGKKLVVTHYLSQIIESADGKVIYKTKAYGKDTNDPWVLSDEDIIGKYAFHVPKAGYVTNFIKSPLGITMITADLAIIITISHLISTEKKKGKKNKE